MRPHHLAALSFPLLFACEHGHEDEPEGPVEIHFEARVADQPFACGQSYTGLGSDGATVTPQDFRFYVYDVHLITVDGAEYPVTLTDDGKFQGGGVALLDFEDGSGACTNGTPETHTTLKGAIGPMPRHGGSHGFAGIRFTIGVPPDLNHADPTLLPAPLNDTTLSWTWNFGHIFLAAWGEFGSGDQAYPLGIHLGSTGCTGDAMAGETVTCTRSNRPEIALAGFDPESSTVVVDWAALFADLALTSPPAECGQSEDGETTCACHTMHPEALCRTLMTPLGLDWQSGESSAMQSLFRVL
ncbi:MAG TPA: MbnP family copper-binding protein [Nannocystis sp.]